MTIVSSVVGQTLLLISAAIVGLCFSRLSRLQPELSCLLAGFGLSLLIPYWGIDSGVRADNLQALIFYVLLPVLIFESCWHMQPAQLKRWLKMIFCLAVPGVFVSCMVFATLSYVAIGHSEGFPLLAALMTGAILSATDPSAISNQLKALNAPTDLRLLLEGESLFNDATTIVLFSLLLGIATTGAGNSAIVLHFLSDFFGGFLLGAMIGLVAAIIVLILGQQACTKIVLLFTAFISYYLSEQILYASGVMSVMGAALISRYCLRDHQHFIEEIDSTWQWLGLLAGSILFVLMGLVITLDMFFDQWLAMLIAVAAALLARAATVYSSAQLSQRWQYHLANEWKPIMIWGGLRGAIAIALVLSLPTSLPYWWTLQSMVFAVVLFNLVIQGTSLSWVASALTQRTSD